MRMYLYIIMYILQFFFVGVVFMLCHFQPARYCRAQWTTYLVGLVLVTADYVCRITKSKQAHA